MTLDSRKFLSFLGFFVNINRGGHFKATAVVNNIYRGGCRRSPAMVNRLTKAVLRTALVKSRLIVTL